MFAAHVGLGDIVPGGLGVSIFFFLSGYLITSLMRAEWSETGHISLRDFYIRRALRILPPLYLVVGVTWILDSFHFPEHQTSGWGILSICFYFYNYLYLLRPQFAGIPVGTAVVWSLTIEEHFYFLFPLLYLLFQRRSWSARKTAAVLSAVCLLALLWRVVLVYLFKTPTDGLVWTYMATDARFDSILWGCVLAIGANPWAGDRNEFLDRYKGALAIGGVVLMLVSLAVRDPNFRQTLRYTLQGIALLPIFYFVASSPASWACRWLAWRPIRWLGWLSYTMYLCHHFLMFAVARVWPGCPPALYTVAVVVSTILVAELVRQLVENPIRRMKQRMHGKAALGI